VQQEFLGVSAATKISVDEANLMVALHAEREMKEGATTLADLAESLHISLTDAERLLTEARNHIQPPVAVEATTSLRVKPRRRWVRWVALTAVALVAAAVFVTPLTRAESQVTVGPLATTGFVTVPAEELSVAPTNGINLNRGDHIDLDVGLTVNGQLFSWQRSPSQEFVGGQTAAQDRLKAAIFRDLEAALPNQIKQARVPFVNVAVRSRRGDWIDFDLPVEATADQFSRDLDLRQAVRARIDRLVKDNRSKIYDKDQ
jgi:hypothetical protein